MRGIGEALATEYPQTNGGWTARLMPIRDLTGGPGFWVVIFLFLMSVALLVAIATANVSNLIMVRAAARARELAVRTAVGAPRGRLLRQFLVEGFALSIAGAALSIPAAWAGLQAIVVISGEVMFQQLRIDWHELSFVATLALLCPIVFSLASARLIVRPDLRAVLAAQGGRGSTARMRGRSALVIAQVSLAVILLTVASLAMRSLREMYSQPIGMESDRMLVLGLEFNEVLYPSIDHAGAAAQATREGLQSLPGVDAVAMMSSLPVLGDAVAVTVTIDGEVAAANDARPAAVVTGASDDFNRALGLRMLAGQWWVRGAHDGVVINNALAQRYLQGAQQAIGHRVAVSQGDRVIDARVIGVVSDIANTNLAEPPPARVFVPLDPSARRITYVVRAVNPAALAAGVRSVVASNAAAVPIDSLRTMNESLDRAAAGDYVIIAVLGGFAFVAVALASAGLFGVVSYTVAQRTSEFGTRMALGARAADVVALVAGDSAKLIAIGLTLGLAGGIGVGFMMRSLLYGLSPADPWTIASVLSLLSIVTVLATALPAWRASRIDPVIALRAD